MAQISMTTIYWMACAWLLTAQVLDATSHFSIQVVDEATGRGVPMVELRTVNAQKYYTDSQGLVAFHEPGLMDRDVFFTVRSHGYEFPKDGFGIRGKKLHTTPGGEAVLKIKRLNVAERLYRVTGGGIYADSILAGRKVPVREGSLNGQVLGSDSVQCLLFRGKIHWFWGDTNRPSYPLGNYDVPGATSLPPAEGGLDPAVGVDLEYFVGADGFAKPTCKMPGTGPTWIHGLAVVKDEDGTERMFADYMKIKPPLSVYEQGLVEFNTDRQEFEKHVVFPADSPIHPGGHTFHHTTDGVEHVYFGQPFPTIRVRATADAIQDLGQYEAFTCVEPTRSVDETRVARDAEGNVRYGWKKGATPFSADVQKKLIAANKLKMSEGLFHVRDVETGKPVIVHHGAVYWNVFRQRWVLIATQLMGSSMLGEIWYAEADTMTGPWAYARKIITHEKQSFYNPKHHPFFDQQNGKIVFFEGTYTHTFSGNEDQTPRYDYNQMMYRLDLSDPRMVLPVAVSNWTVDEHPRDQPRAPTFESIAFFACDREFPSSKAIQVNATSNGAMLAGLDREKSENVRTLYIMSSNSKVSSDVFVPLFEHRSETGRTRYLVGEESASGFRKSATPVGRVWVNPAR